MVVPLVQRDWAAVARRKLSDSAGAGVTGLSKICQKRTGRRKQSVTASAVGADECVCPYVNPYGAFISSRLSAGTYFTAAVRSNLSQANLRPSSARFSVLNRTIENN